MLCGIQLFSPSLIYSSKLGPPSNFRVLNLFLQTLGFLYCCFPRCKTGSYRRAHCTGFAVRTALSPLCSCRHELTAGFAVRPALYHHLSAPVDMSSALYHLSAPIDVSSNNAKYLPAVSPVFWISRHYPRGSWHAIQVENVPFGLYEGTYYGGGWPHAVLSSVLPKQKENTCGQPISKNRCYI